MRPPRLRVEGGVRAVPRLCIKLGPGICLTTEENHGKTSVRAIEISKNGVLAYIWFSGELSAP